MKTSTRAGLDISETDRLIAALKPKPEPEPPKPQLTPGQLAFMRMHAAWAKRHRPHLLTPWLNKEDQ